jgi:phosphoribosyl 1,2-cyclic phosphate phosphodiesterase
VLHTINDKPFDVLGTKVTPIEVMHHKLPVTGFRINDFTYITDAKTITEESLLKISGTKILVINALQKEDHVSHLTFNEAIALANKIGAEKTFFTHMSHTLGLHSEIEKELPTHINLAYDGLSFEVV